MLSRLTSRTSLIAVDMGACALRAVQLIRRGGRAGGWDIHHWINLEREPESAQPVTADLAERLELVFGPGGFTRTRCGLLLNPPDVEYRLMDAPGPVLALPPAQLAAALQFELERQLPWPVAEAETAAWKVRETSGGGTAMVLAARRADVQRQLDLLTARELDCLKADVVPNAMVQFGAASGFGSERSRIWGVLDLGFQSARLYLMSGHLPVFARVLRGGGREMTEALATGLRLEFPLAEQYKRLYGVRKGDRGARAAGGGLGKISEDTLPEVIYSVCRPVLEGMTSEIERACRFVLGQVPQAEFDRLLLIGGQSRMPGLRTLLGETLGVPVTAPEPSVAFAGLLSRHPQHRACAAGTFAMLAPCLGMAMKEPV